MRTEFEIQPAVGLLGERTKGSHGGLFLCPMSIPDQLTSLGWRNYPNQFKKGAQMWCKRFPGTRCRGNYERDGIQVELYFYPTEDNPHSVDTFEMELNGQIADGGWFGIHRWAIDGGLTGALALVPSILAQWEFAANYPAQASHAPACSGEATNPMNTDTIPECPDCGFLPEIHEDRYVCVLPTCKRALVGIVRESWETITREEIEEAKRRFVETGEGGQS